MAVPVTGQFVDVTGVRLHYQRGGEADASVMLLHGGGTDSSGLSWGLLLPELAQAHMVIAPDWPGYGQSERAPHTNFTQEYYLDFLESFLDFINQRIDILA